MSSEEEEGKSESIFIKSKIGHIRITRNIGGNEMIMSPSSYNRRESNGFKGMVSEAEGYEIKELKKEVEEQS